MSLLTRLYDTQHRSIDVPGFRVSRQPGEALRRLGVLHGHGNDKLEVSPKDAIASGVYAMHRLARLCRTCLEPVQG